MGIFTDDEHRILLAALGREEKVCIKEDQEAEEAGAPGKPLLPMVRSIQKKVSNLQKMNESLEEHFLTATEPEWDSKNIFWRCPSCKRRIQERHSFCKHCGKKMDWMPLIEKRKKEAEVHGRKDRKKICSGQKRR